MLENMFYLYSIVSLQTNPSLMTSPSSQLGEPQPQPSPSPFTQQLQSSPQHWKTLRP
jgi:hypothetical protein